MLPPLRVALSPAPGLCTLVLFIVAVVTLAGAAPRQPQEAGPAPRPGPGLGPRATVPSEAFELRNGDPLSGDYGKVRGPPTKATAYRMATATQANLRAGGWPRARRASRPSLHGEHGARQAHQERRDGRARRWRSTRM